MHRTQDTAYVQFGDGSYLCFDIALDPTWRTPLTDPKRILDMAQRMLVWRSCHTNRTHSGLLIDNGGVGQWPSGVSWKDTQGDMT